MTASSNAGAGFEFGYDNGVDPPGDPYIDQGLNDSLRILGIGGNETTGQSRVPVVITSVHDSSVGALVRGVNQSQVIPNDAVAPKPGDGGAIVFGGNITNDYNAFDLREGNRIDNVDISFITRIEMQGGGDMVDPLGTATTPSIGTYALRAGTLGTLANGQPNPNDGDYQDNMPKLLTISDSNLSSFSQVGVLAVHGNQLLINGVRDTTSQGEGRTRLFMWNDTISNMPTGVRMVGEQVDNILAPNPSDLVLLNDTFYNDALGVDVVSINADGTNSESHVHLVAMDNIFANSATAGIQDLGQIQGSVLEYNLYWQNGVNINDLPGSAGLNGANFQPIFGDPKFRNAAAGNLQLTEGSAAIDAGRSELNLNLTSNGAQVGALVPTADQLLTAAGGTRNANSRLPDDLLFNLVSPPSNELALPGYVGRGYIDEWVPVLATSASAIPGPESNASTWDYAPINGQRDELGYLRIKDPNSPNVGFGAEPFFDIGAFEFRTFNPPHVTNVQAVVTNPASPAGGTTTVPLYKVGGDAGTNQQIQSLLVSFDGLIDPATITGSSVLLEASGGDGIFGNNNSANDKFYNLSGKLSFNATTKILTINVGAAGLVLQSDEYRLFLEGNGSNVLANPQGVTLDGENTVGDTPNGAQLALPSGDGFPGGTFFDTFVVNTQAPTILPGTFGLAQTSDSNVVGDSITDSNLPSFTGTISVALPQIVPLAGQTVIVDVSTKGFSALDPTTGQPIFDRLNAGTAVTNGTGGFTVTVGQDGANTGLVTNTAPLPDSPYVVGANGQIQSPNAVGTTVSGYSIVRIRVLDQSGNASDQPSDTYLMYLANGAATNVIVDTAPPHVTSISPTAGSQIVPDKTGAVTFTFKTDKNIDPTSLNANSILVTRAGPDGVLGTTDDVSVPINVNSITTKFLGSAAGAKGPEQISFSISGNLPNDLYQVTLKGAGTSPVFDVAGNALAGAGAAGTDFKSTYVLYNANNLAHIWVGPEADVTDPTASAGTRNNPFPTIGQAMAQSTVGTIVAVLPGVYTENVTLKPFVQLWSVAAIATDSNMVPGNAQQTVIRAPASGLLGTGNNVTVTGTNIPFIGGVPTEVRGFTIASPLLFDPALGTIDPTTTGVLLINSAVLLDHDYVIDGQIGVHVVSSGIAAPGANINDDGIIGNVFGIVVEDKGLASSLFLNQIVNDTIAYNTIGVAGIDTASSPLLAFLGNDIFWQNHDLTTARSGTGVFSVFPNKLILQSSMFSGNGPNTTSPGDDAINVGNGFNASILGPTPDPYGNFVGNPAFVAPRDPRPGGDGPATFFLDANFDLTASSAAIDAANSALAPNLDFLFRGRVRIAGKGFPGTGPADVGAFEYKGSGGITAGGTFRVVTTSLSTTGSATLAGQAISASQLPSSIVLTFSDYTNRATLMPSDLVFTGSGINPARPVKATSITWLTPTTAQFNLTGSFNSSGTVFMSMAYGLFKSLSNTPNLGFVDFFNISPAYVPPTVTPIVAPPVKPPALPAGPALGKKAKKKA